MLEIPFNPEDSLADVMERAKILAYEKWGNLCEFTIVQPAYGEEKIAKIFLTGHTISVRWDVASGNVAAFYQRMKVLALSAWGKDAEFDILLRPDGYADIVRKG